MQTKINTKQQQKTTYAFGQSVGFALNGIAWFFITERNAKIQSMVFIATCFAGFYLGITPIEWCLVLLCGALVMGLEMLNSAIEQLCNDYHPDYKQSIMFIKDASAGAVLLASVCSVVVGGIIFVPKLISFFKL